jgi:hypothetical protein
MLAAPPLSGPITDRRPGSTIDVLPVTGRYTLDPVLIVALSGASPYQGPDRSASQAGQRSTVLSLTPFLTVTLSFAVCFFYSR